MTSKNKQTSGYTLIEFMCVLAIISILATFSFNAQQIFTRLKIEHEHNKIISFLKASRNAAVSNSAHIHICNLANGTCKKNKQWHKNISSFIDTNLNKQLDATEKILFKHQLSSNTHINLLTLDTIRFNKLGMSKELGSFTICSSKNKFYYNSRISLSMQGRYNLKSQDYKKEC